MKKQKKADTIEKSSKKRAESNIFLKRMTKIFLRRTFLDFVLAMKVFL